MTAWVRSRSPKRFKILASRLEAKGVYKKQVWNFHTCSKPFKCPLTSQVFTDIQLTAA
jgi:hypothetical protein